MSCAQQNNTNKRSPHAQSVCNFVVTHIGVVAHDQGHASANAKFVESFANFFAGTLFDQALELIGIGSFEWHFGYVFGLFVLAKLAAAEQVPAVVSRHFVEPSREGAAFIVLSKFVAQLHKNLHGRVFRVFTRGHGPAAKTKNRRCILTIKIAPSVGIPGPRPNNPVRRVRFSRCAHSTWSQRFHNLVRRRGDKTITGCYEHRSLNGLGGGASSVGRSELETSQ